MTKEPLITWESLKALLPHDLSGLAKSTGAVQRWRKIARGEQLLWLCFIYAQAFMSIRVTAGLSVGFGGVTDEAVRYRLVHASPFLSAILAHVLNASAARLCFAGLQRSIRLVDSTSLSVPGSTGTDCRIHACYVPGHGFAGVDITDATGGESVERAEVSPMDICVMDQGYCRAAELHHVHARGAYSLVRVYLRNIRLLDVDGNKLDIKHILDRADAGDSCTTVYVPCKGREPLKARIIVRRLPEDKAKASRKKLRRKASRNCMKVTELGLRLAGYFVVLTTVPSDCLCDEDVLELYRLRWQVELLFKRWKSLLSLDRLEAKDPALVRTFCLSKLIEAAVLERLSTDALDQYESTLLDDDDRPACTLWRLTVVYHAAFQAAVLSVFPIAREHLCRVMDRMREGKRRRAMACTRAAPMLRRLASSTHVREAA